MREPLYIYIFLFNLSQIYFLEFLDFVALIFSKKKYIYKHTHTHTHTHIYIYIYIYMFEICYTYIHTKYNYLFQKTKEKIDFQKTSKIN